jgi:hypothetical protein
MRFSHPFGYCWCADFDLSSIGMSSFHYSFWWTVELPAAFRPRSVGCYNFGHIAIWSVTASSSPFWSKRWLMMRFSSGALEVGSWIRRETQADSFISNDSFCPHLLSLPQPPARAVETSVLSSGSLSLKWRRRAAPPRQPMPPPSPPLHRPVRPTVTPYWNPSSAYPAGAPRPLACLRPLLLAAGKNRWYSAVPAPAAILSAYPTAPLGAPALGQGGVEAAPLLSLDRQGGGRLSQQRRRTGGLQGTPLE